ncbi:MAG: NifU family protein [Alphaproteobacteria bacterium]|nr:NifU family protein [Alphaproteobacteria bacterium]
MFIQTEDTPNPVTMKFVPGRVVMDAGTLNIENQAAARGILLAERLFAIPGVEGVFFGSDFISVTKKATIDWLLLKPSILGAIMEYFLMHEKVESVELQPKAPANQSFGENAGIVAEIIEILDQKVRPAVAQDGGDIVFDRFEEGIVYLKMQGACSGCPSSTLTLKSGIENMLKHYVPEVTEVRSVQ